ncbi:1-acyl-sn-glycerol-3-phosphate acyltransferase gamma isoform X1 [Amia ocellicauda]|uniref:1-acyl-sn-glycerol-3-phosphate acyltransferase gamma isoform X1 n=1 Tax=Amia ocellicauda TaxID=2972642 RepID=UPI003463B026
MIMGFIAYLKTQFILHLLISFVFIVSGLIINFIQLCTLVFWPINKQLYRRVNCRLSYSLWSQLVMLLEWWSGTECTLFTDKATVDKFGKEHAIVILNHNFEIDFLCGWTICERFGVLGSSKVLAKQELLKVPLIGWTWYFLEIVFCKRKWEEDRDKVIKGLQNLSDYPECMWILLYCEGTRFTEKKHQISMQVAESKCLPKLKYHLLPRTKGFTTTMQCLKGTVSAVYDVTLNFKDKKNPSLLGILYGKKYEADMSVRRFPVEDIPEDEKECANWLHKLYQEKDALQEDYENEGCFPGAQYKPPRRPWTVLNFLFWATVLLSPLINFAAGVFVSGSPLLIIGFILFIGIACFAVRRLIGVTEIEKGSSYGNQEVKKKN